MWGCGLESGGSSQGPVAVPCERYKHLGDCQFFKEGITLGTSVV